MLLSGHLDPFFSLDCQNGKSTGPEANSTKRRKARAEIIKRAEIHTITTIRTLTGSNGNGALTGLLACVSVRWIFYTKNFGFFYTNFFHTNIFVFLHQNVCFFTPIFYNKIFTPIFYNTIFTSIFYNKIFTPIFYNKIFTPIFYNNIFTPIFYNKIVAFLHQILKFRKGFFGKNQKIDVKKVDPKFGTHICGQ